MTPESLPARVAWLNAHDDAMANTTTANTDTTEKEETR